MSSREWSDRSDSEDECSESSDESEDGYAEISDEDAMRRSGGMKAQLRDHLDNIYGAGEISCQGELLNAPNPGLLIENCGIIRFPLAYHDIDRIVAASKQEDTPAKSPSVKSWTISDQQLKLTNPAWNVALESVLQKVQEGMHLGTKKLSATLINLVISEAGTDFQIDR